MNQDIIHHLEQVKRNGQHTKSIVLEENDGRRDILTIHHNEKF